MGGYRPRRPFLVLDKVYPKGVFIPKELIGLNMVHLLRLKTHVFTTITGAMKNAFGGLLHRKPPLDARGHPRHARRPADDPAGDPPRAVRADGLAPFAGDGPGPRAMRWHQKDILLASADQVAIDAVSATLQASIR